MKATPETLAKLRAAMVPVAPKVTAHRDALAKTEKYANGAGNLPMRVRWDWFWAACPSAYRDTIPQLHPQCQDFGDGHLDTALRQIARECGFDDIAAT